MRCMTRLRSMRVLLEGSPRSVYLGLTAFVFKPAGDCFVVEGSGGVGGVWDF